LSACQLWLPDPNPIPILPWIDGSYTTSWDTTNLPPPAKHRLRLLRLETGTEGPILDPEKTSDPTRTKLHRIKG